MKNKWWVKVDKISVITKKADTFSGIGFFCQMIIFKESISRYGNL